MVQKLIQRWAVVGDFAQRVPWRLQTRKEVLCVVETMPGTRGRQVVTDPAHNRHCRGSWELRRLRNTGFFFPDRIQREEKYCLKRGPVDPSTGLAVNLQRKRKRYHYGIDLKCRTIPESSQ